MLGLQPRPACAKLGWKDPDTVEDRSGLVGIDAKAAAHKRVHLAREALQRIDDSFIDLFIEDKGAAVRRELQKVVKYLGPTPALARDLLTEPGPEIDFDLLQPLADRLGTSLALAVNWTYEADDCWNSACGVQTLDEARESYLEATSILLNIESLRWTAEGAPEMI